MSLINEALKKAQRQRNAPSASPGADTGENNAGAPVVKRGTPMRAQTVIVIVAAAAVLIVVSVVLTVFLVNRPSASPTPPPVAVVRPAVDLDAPPPVIVAPPLSPPPTSAVARAPDANAAATPSSNVSLPNSGSVGAGGPTAAPLPAAASGAADSTSNTASSIARPAPTTAPAVADPRISAFVDAIRVTGIRSSGNESKVLMNDRVHRVNDVVERSLGVTLMKVSPDSLTFTDANGVIYIKNF